MSISERLVFPQNFVFPRRSGDGNKCCKKCPSENIVKNGSNRIGNSKYTCKDCGFFGLAEYFKDAFSTSEVMHELYLKCFIHNDNMPRIN